MKQFALFKSMALAAVLLALTLTGCRHAEYILLAPPGTTAGTKFTLCKPAGKSGKYTLITVAAASVPEHIQKGAFLAPAGAKKASECIAPDPGAGNGGDPGTGPQDPGGEDGGAPPDDGSTPADPGDWSGVIPNVSVCQATYDGCMTAGGTDMSCDAESRSCVESLCQPYYRSCLSWAGTSSEDQFLCWQELDLCRAWNPDRGNWNPHQPL